MSNAQDNEKDRFLGYYSNELHYLRNAGGVFAKEYPKVARRLELNDKESPDPHTERLLESFAFLAARLNQKIDDALPQIASSLLEVLYPHLITPIPSMTIAHFQADTAKAKMTGGNAVPKGTTLVAQASEGITCRFQTVYPVTLWPLKIKSVDLVRRQDYDIKYQVGDYEQKLLYSADGWFLRLHIESKSLDLSALSLEALQLHIRGNAMLSSLIYENLFAQKHPHVFLAKPGDQVAHSLPKDSLHADGFDRAEAALPLSKHSIHAYQLLQEYFHFPDKFMFFSILNLNRGLDAMGGKATDGLKEIDILISINDGGNLLQQNLSPSNFLLGCTPIINLFRKITDPLRLDKRKVSYRLVPDQRRDRTTEIHSIIKVSAADEGKKEPSEIFPYYSSEQASLSASDTDAVYWMAKRTPSGERGIPGMDIDLSFVDLQYNYTLPPQQIVYAQTLCTNRFLAEQLPQGALLQIEAATPVTRIVCLDKPTSQVYSPVDGETLWRLVSQLAVNHLSLTGGDRALRHLKQTLKLYVGSSNTHRLKEIDHIVALKTTQVTHRFGKEGWRGFVNGTQVTLEASNQMPRGDSGVMLASILRHYFALNVSINSFVEVILKNNSQQEERMKWQPLPGEKTPL
ncbi:MAG: type VI secretion system baseplate subunit TssF [Alphaproteobacteria bacterium]|nr:type VI secretion system baseplate subunit TssF [Alphaproteobacteria bacterium]